MIDFRRCRKLIRGETKQLIVGATAANGCLCFNIRAVKNDITFCKGTKHLSEELCRKGKSRLVAIIEAKGDP